MVQFILPGDEVEDDIRVELRHNGGRDSFEVVIVDKYDDTYHLLRINENGLYLYDGLDEEIGMAVDEDGCLKVNSERLA